MLLRRRRRGGHGHLLKLLPLVEWRTLAATAVWWCGCLLGDTSGPTTAAAAAPQPPPRAPPPPPPPGAAPSPPDRHRRLVHLLPHRRSNLPRIPPRCLSHLRCPARAQCDRGGLLLWRRWFRAKRPRPWPQRRRRRRHRRRRRRGLSRQRWQRRGFRRRAAFRSRRGRCRRKRRSQRGRGPLRRRRWRRPIAAVAAATVTVVAAVAVAAAGDGAHARRVPPLPPPPSASSKIDPSHTRRHERRHRRVHRQYPGRWAPPNKGSGIPSPLNTYSPNTDSPLRPLMSLRPVSSPRAIKVKALPPLPPYRLQRPLHPPHCAADAGCSILSTPRTAPTTDRVVSTTFRPP